MKEKIYEIITTRAELSLTGNYKSVYIDGLSKAADDVTQVMVDFIEWLFINNIDCTYSDVNHFFFTYNGINYNTDELFDYWYKKINI